MAIPLYRFTKITTNSLFITILLIVLFFNNVYAQHILKIRDSSTKKVYLIKAEKTPVYFTLLNNSEIIKDVIDSADGNGIYLKLNGKVKYNDIQIIEFTPYTNSISNFNSIYFSSMSNITLFLNFQAYNSSNNSAFQASQFMLRYIPLWGLLIPGLINLGLYVSNPHVKITHIGAENFKLNRGVWKKIYD
ncbi:MAG: hypothetical protein WCK82_01430 [Bacteroidota bacterium]|jgi:hypothetical protein